MELKLKEYRISLKLTQIQVSDVLDVTQAQYSKLELGKSLLNADQIITLCKLFKCTPNDLLGFYGDYKVILDLADQD
jgi:transcriptional regulator with XRE-family HTH domain